MISSSISTCHRWPLCIVGLRHRQRTTKMVPMNWENDKWIIVVTHEKTTKANWYPINIQSHTKNTQNINKNCNLIGRGRKRLCGGSQTRNIGQWICFLYQQPAKTPLFSLSSYSTILLGGHLRWRVKQWHKSFTHHICGLNMMRPTSTYIVYIMEQTWNKRNKLFIEKKTIY